MEFMLYETKYITTFPQKQRKETSTLLQSSYTLHEVLHHLDVD